MTIPHKCGGGKSVNGLPPLFAAPGRVSQNARLFEIAHAVIAASEVDRLQFDLCALIPQMYDSFYYYTLYIEGQIINYGFFTIFKIAYYSTRKWCVRISCP